MNETMINNWNSVVNDDDTVIHNGDFGWFNQEKYFKRLKGKKILIRGNHDNGETLKLEWQSVHDYLEFKHNGVGVVMFHYPIEEWHHSYYDTIHLYGHVHDRIPPITNPGFGNDPIRHNICVEFLNYTPRNLDFYTKKENK